ncbi:MAG: NAD(P)-dependent oxidoreductase [Pseudomonadota bacterium]
MKVAFLGNLAGFEAAKQHLRGMQCLRIDPDAPNHSQIEDLDGIIDGALKIRLDASFLNRTPRLRAIVSASTGTDHIDLDALAERNIAFDCLRNYPDFLDGITSTPEHAWALLLGCARQLTRAHAHVQLGDWDRMAFPAFGLSGKVLGLVGLGRVGRHLAKYGAAFGMQVLAFDPAPNRIPDGVEMVDFEGLLANSDVVSVQVHLAPETRHLLNAKALGLMKPRAIFINVSRGALVDEEALARSLQSGHLLAAGLDVIEGEPDVRASPLWPLLQDGDRVLLTPHIAGTAVESLSAACGKAGELMESLLRAKAGMSQ